MSLSGYQTSGVSAFKLSETILKTSRLDEMKSWYRVILGVEPFFEHAPPKNSKALDLGGQTRASDLRTCFFRLSVSYPFVQMISIFEEPGTATWLLKAARDFIICN